MIWDWKHKALAIGFVLALLAGGWAIHLYVAEMVARGKAEAVQSAQSSIIAQTDARDKQRDELLAQALATISKQKQAVETPTQAAISIPQQLNPQLPAPIVINVPPNSTLPATVTVPQPDLKPLSDMLFDCAADKAKVAHLEADEMDWQTKYDAMTKERDQWRETAEGGTKWTRVKRDFGIGWKVAAITVAILCGLGHCK